MYVETLQHSFCLHWEKQQQQTNKQRLPDVTTEEILHLRTPDVLVDDLHGVLSPRMTVHNHP